MGLGDQLIATGIAKGARAKGHRIAFGVDGKVLWDKYSKDIFRDNPNVVSPGGQYSDDVRWVPFYKGHRMYNQDGGDHWIWNTEWRCQPGEVYFSKGELVAGTRNGGTIIVEPSVVSAKGASVNKHWSFDKYQQVTDALVGAGHRVSQFVYGSSGRVLKGARGVPTRNFRDALAVLRSSVLYVGPEGGLHHGAAAVDLPAVVLFGGFIPPSVTGYDAHYNIASSDRFCGSYSPCQHCRDAMDRITADEVYEATKRFI